MSFCVRVRKVLEILDLEDDFDFIASRDDVDHGKPDPEIYLLVAKELGCSPSECLVIEDSPTGVQAGLNAGMNVVAISTPFTKKRLHEADWPPEEHIVDDPNMLPSVVAQVVEQINRGN
jgi:beta-phosphoglucomutase-like phosphatase (HAD superfamily)